MRAERSPTRLRIPDELWERVQLFLPRFPRQKTGRPRLDMRKVVDGIFYILRTGCQWKAAPSEFGSRNAPQHFCGDKGYDYPDTRLLVEEYGYTLHIKSRGDGARDLRAVPRYRARRWVVERTHSWLNRFHRLLIRWEKKADNFLAMLHFACAYITFRAAGLFGWALSASTCPRVSPSTA